MIEAIISSKFYSASSTMDLHRWKLLIIVGLHGFLTACLENPFRPRSWIFAIIHNLFKGFLQEPKLGGLCGSFIVILS